MDERCVVGIIGASAVSHIFARIIKMTNGIGRPNTLEGLPRNPKREAIDTLAGYDYQIWSSIEAWILLGPDECIFLEGAEDIDQVGTADATSTQIRRTAGKISLNTNYARDAIKNFWSTQEREVGGRKIQYRYVTTSEVAMEQNAAFDGRNGIEMWGHARHDLVVVETMRTYLIGSLGATGTLLSFLETAPAPELRERLFRRFFWLTHMPAIDVVRDSVLDRLERRVADSRISRTELAKVRSGLFAYCWERVKKDATERILTSDALDKEIESGTTIQVPMPLTAVGTMLAATLQLPSLQQQVANIAIMNIGVPELPYPLLERPDLQTTLTTAFNRRQSVLLTGSVFKGKSTIAAVIAASTCPDAWWISLSDRNAAQVQDIFKLVTLLIESPSAPLMIVLDDLNLCATFKRVYINALRKLIHRANTGQKSLFLTAQGQSQELDTETRETLELEFIDVPALQEAEISGHCVALGCPSQIDAEMWGRLISAQTGGHPRLVQVRLKELQEASWPELTADDFLGRSPAVHTARQLARALFHESVPSPEAEYIYVAAEFTGRPTREMLLNLGDLVPGLPNPGDVIDKLSGKWVEVHASKRYRVTPILRAVVGENWSQARFQKAHAAIHDAIRKCGKYSPADGAALIFHAYMAKDGDRLAPIALHFCNISDALVKEELYKNLSWLLVLRSSENAHVFPEHPFASVALRQLQFSVSIAEGSNEVKEFALGWQREVDAMDDPTGGAQVLLSLSLLVASVPLPFDILVKCALSLQDAKSEIADMAKGLLQEAHVGTQMPEFPNDATIFQRYLALKANMVRSLDDFKELVSWLRSVEQPGVVEDFDEIFTWPLVATLGSFVHSCWVADSRKENVEWDAWVTALRSAWDVAVEKHSSAFGREIAKALSIIYGEYLGDKENANAVLAEATAAFGGSAVLDEQLMNTYYVQGDFAAAYDTWERLVATYGDTGLTDAFAFRRAAISAARLGKWDKAMALFLAGAATLPEDSTISTRCGLLTDAAYACARTSNWRMASHHLSVAVLQLPPQASAEGDNHWQGVIQLMSLTAKIVGEKSFEEYPAKSVMNNPGYTSNPDFPVSELSPGQELRVEILKMQTALVESQWPDASTPLMQTAALGSAGTHPSVQFFAARAMLQHQVLTGVDSDFVTYMARLSNSMVMANLKRSPDSSPEPIRQSLGSLMQGLAIVALLSARGNALGLVDEWIATSTRDQQEDFDWLAQLRTGLTSEVSATGVNLRTLNTLTAQAGAALAVLASTNRTARMVAEAQGFLTRLMTGNAIFSSTMGNYGRLVALAFSRHWRDLVSSPHMFVAPRISLPPLSAAIEAIEQGEGSLAELLIAAGVASGTPLDTAARGVPT